MTEQKRHVLIIGAGITGLLIAQGLKKEGISFSVYESEPSASHYRPREWGMSVQWALPLLQDCLPLHLYDCLSEAAVDPFHEPADPGILPTLNGATGEFIKNVPLVRMYRMSRRRFRAFCTQGIDVQYGKALKGINYEDGLMPTVIARFEDDSTATGTLLVGTDGAQSRVRTHIFGEERGRALTVPYSAVNLHVNYHDAEKAEFVRQLHPIMAMGIHPEGYWLWISIQDVVDPNDPLTWNFQLQATWRQKEGEDVSSLANLKRRAETFGEPFRSAFLSLPEDATVLPNRMSYWMPIPWDTHGGRIVLAGDAAHPMTFQRGQGMNHGIADASNLTKLVKAAAAGEIGWKEGIEAYQDEMIDRAGDEVATSKMNTEMLHDWERCKSSPLLVRGGDARKATGQY
ncbi:MAG: hypothetical protein M1820_006507 [Bogoriella megaspora]|nr:MAG: hypothetical protein M1820_006507 [Bogoriella megaspora]